MANETGKVSYRYTCSECGEDRIEEHLLEESALCEFCKHHYLPPVRIEGDFQSGDLPGLRKVISSR